MKHGISLHRPSDIGLDRGIKAIVPVVSGIWRKN
jgi:hypothetical protein